MSRKALITEGSLLILAGSDTTSTGELADEIIEAK